ncbi:twin-arginine translocation signal domain-containing protein [Pseudomonas syringae]|uniref:twin-arginine translocation signal domain-containing protein n=1 Tax=Pseudomonas syringae TaxID=317 RepID=UPI001F3B112B|nr:twin-arginine translocation signal domain-containing protein [Pseudomonas syringae]MCF5382080.1 twin-arginine translocation signal domain-containing protein [Pseudomonas syringae]MCF5419336.1 twin-arginine translocation signal domain-containing protein [Pseudomonas syringae]MCF5454466.1 twin-arginine translocation signal domain-containing protein [Pseudomonas syringae]MCF5458408.1 twin-arginine translocation signal domain-containing protein [Pseudomonas syringae]
MIYELPRRQFLKLSATAIAAAAFGMGVYSPAARASIVSIATLLVIDPITLEYKVFGPCCYFCTDYLIVSHYQPVVLCEVIKGGGDTVLGQPIGGPLSAGVDDNDYTSMHVRLWQIPDWAINIAMLGQGCKMCGVDAATSPATPSPTSLSLCSAATDKLIGAATAKANSAMPNCFPKLLYTTESDIAWNTGCRDWLQLPVTELECSTIGATISNMFGFERCIGSQWGPLYPRQMATARDNPIVAAGAAAYRALHIARNALATLPFDTTLSIGRLQQTSPMVTTGFSAGSVLLNTEMLLGPVSPTHIYTFVYWLPVVCCKDYEEIFGFCSPESPCG